jgi:vancomycin resistance protein VanW
MIIKKWIPKNIKLGYNIVKRNFFDTKFISKNSFAKINKSEINFPFSIKTLQEIKNGTFLDNKIHNLKLASNYINTIIIYPNEIFSFWKIVKNPSEKNGFKKGRNIVNQKVSEEVGGGLCQLSGIMYHTSLKANLEIIERHNHSVDIYAESDRFTPLGADATVVYGYKDLRIKNNLAFPIQFEIKIIDQEIVCSLKSVEIIDEHLIEFTVLEKAEILEVSTLSNSRKIAISNYKKIDELRC